MEHPRASSELPPIGSIRMDINGSVRNPREAALAVSTVSSSSVAVAVAEIVVPIPPIVIPIAVERWNVQKKRLEFESEIDALYRVEIQKCMSIDKASNERATKLYNEVFYKAKWSNPPLPVVQQKLILGYCKHLLTIGTKVMYPHTESLVVWDGKHTGKVHEKTWKGLRKLSQKLFDLIERRDSRIKSTQSKLMQQTGAMSIKNDAHLRWMMESNFSKRDEYFSIWFLAATGNISVLKTLLNSTNKMKEYTYGINTGDVDFGLSPLHYACKSIDLAMVRYLLSKGASVYQRSPDGRTPLHFAAAYSVKEVVLELLGEGGDALHGATDHHGRTALQLALQNHNKNTITTLQNWSKLTTTLLVEDENIPLVTGHHTDGTVMNKSSSITIKSSSPSKNKIVSTATKTKTAISPVPYDYPVDDDNNDDDDDGDDGDDDDGDDKGVTAVPPYEYQVAADEVVSKMSPSLRLMLKRLNSYNKFYLRCKKTNHDPSDMLRSKDLSVISAMLQSSSSVVVGADHEGGVKHYNTSINNNYQDNTNSNNNYQDNTNSNNNYQDNTNNNNNYQDNSMSIAAIQERIDEILVEIRLATKCYSLCVQECFLDEAMRALRRRWTIAKELWMMLVKLQRDGMDQQQVPTAVANLDVAIVKHSHHRDGYNGEHHVLQTRQYTLGGALDISHNDEGDYGGYANSASPLQSDTYIESQSDRMRSDEGVAPPRPILNGVDPSTLHPPDAYSTVYEACDRDFTPLFAEQGDGGRRPTEIDDDKDDDDDGDDDKDAGAAPSGGSSTEDKIGVTDIPMEEEGSINSRRRGRADVCSTSSSSSSSSSSSTIIDLEQLAVAYNMSHPTPCSSIDDLYRPADYESIGSPVYKISEGIFWESSDGLKAHHHVEAGITNSKGNDDNNDVDAGRGSVILQHQSSAVDVIKQWQQISKARSKKQQSVLDIYYWINDESLRDGSLLTESNVDDTSSHGSINSHERQHQKKKKKKNQQKDKLRSSTGPSVVNDEDDASTVLNHSVDSFSYLSNHLHHHSSYKYQYPFRGSYIVKLGMELSSAFITRRDEGSALLVAHECGDITVEVDHVTRIAMLERQCDILLFLYDYLSKHPPPLTHRARVMLNAVKKLSRVSIKDDGDDDDAVVRLEKVSLSVEQPFVSDSINGGVQDVNPSSSSSSSSSSSTNIIEKTNNIRFIDQQLGIYRKSFSSILSLCTTILEESLQLHRTFYSADIIEPISFSIALSRRSKVFELQQQRDEESLLSMQAAEEAAVRTLGGSSHEAITAALEVLRLWIKYRLTTREELTFVNKKAQQINSNIVQYSQIDIESAERFTKRCVEYVSIATVAVNRVEEEEDKARRLKRREERRIALERIS